MPDTKILTNTADQSEFDELFFNRPVSRLGRFKVGILVCKHASMVSVNSAYSILVALGHDVVLIADDVHQQNSLPAELFLASKPGIYYQESDLAISKLQDCKAIIALVEGELNSKMELLIGQLLRVYTGTFVCDYQKILRSTGFEGEKILFSPILALSARQSRKVRLGGINQIVEMLFELSRSQDLSVVSAQKNQIVAVRQKYSEAVCVVNAKGSIKLVDFIAILIGLLVDAREATGASWLQHCQAAGFLYQNHYSESKNGVADLKSYLDGKF